MAYEAVAYIHGLCSYGGLYMFMVHTIMDYIVMAYVVMAHLLWPT